MVVGKKSSFISICSWNVGGLISKTYNKLKYNAFIQEISPYDVVFLSETHIGNDVAVHLYGFQYISICRSMSKNSRYYGGLAILIRNSVRKGIQILQNTSSEFQWVKLSKDFFNLNNDIVVSWYLGLNFSAERANVAHWKRTLCLVASIVICTVTG